MELINAIDETFKFENKEIRVIGTYDKPLFIAKDICNILGLANTTEALRNIPDKWMTSEILKSSYNSQHMKIISEPAVYKLIMRSNKPIAQKFQEVVCEEILPSIRKKGEYKLEKLLKDKEEQLNTLQNQNKSLSRRVRKKIIDRNKKGKCLYILFSDEIKDKVKIGSTFNIKKRISDLSCGNPERLNIIELYYTNCYIMLEESIKKIFSKYRISLSCEWYENSILEKIQEYIEEYIELYNKFEKFSNFDDIDIIEEENIDEIFKKRVCEDCKEQKDINDYFKNSKGDIFLKICKNCYEKNNKFEEQCKQCNNCFEIQTIYNFTIERTSTDGLSYFCKKCKSNMRKEKLDKKKDTKIIGKKQCKTCKIFDYNKMFFKTDIENNIYSEECILCYNKEHGQSKQCSKCNVIKNVFHYNKAIQNTDGLSGTCKDCDKKKRDNKIKNRKEIIEHNIGKKECSICKESFKYQVFFKRFLDNDKKTFEYYDECRNCFTPNSLQCVNCREIKQDNLFGIDSTKTTGHRSSCKSCTNERDRKRSEENKKQQNGSR